LELERSSECGIASSIADSVSERSFVMKRSAWSTL